MLIILHTIQEIKDGSIDERPGRSLHGNCPPILVVIYPLKLLLNLLIKKGFSRFGILFLKRIKLLLGN